MQFYTITPTSNPQIIGSNYPQMECIDVKLKDGLDKISESKGARITHVGEIYNLRLPSKGKTTDIISCSLGAGGDFIISNKLHEVLKDLSCTSIQFFPIIFEHKKDLYRDFYWVHFIYQLEKLIDFEKSEYDDFFIENINADKPKNYIEFSALVQQHRKLNHFRLTKTILKKNFPTEEDLFVLSFANQNKYISEKLYKIILSESISGLDIHLARDITITSS